MKTSVVAYMALIGIALSAGFTFCEVTFINCSIKASGSEGGDFGGTYDWQPFDKALTLAKAEHKPVMLIIWTKVWNLICLLNPLMW